MAACGVWGGWDGGAARVLCVALLRLTRCHHGGSKSALEYSAWLEARRKGLEQPPLDLSAEIAAIEARRDDE